MGLSSHQCGHSEPPPTTPVAIRIDTLTTAERFELIRRRRGLTQGDLAAQAKVGPVTVSRIESGRVVPRLKTVRKLATALGASPAWLAGFTD
jgi:transcriptional regulator with XRE-family HTH domain